MQKRAESGIGAHRDTMGCDPMSLKSDIVIYDFRVYIDELDDFI